MGTKTYFLSISSFVEKIFTSYFITYLNLYKVGANYSTNKSPDIFFSGERWYHHLQSPWMTCCRVGQPVMRVEKKSLATDHVSLRIQ